MLEGILLLFPSSKITGASHTLLRMGVGAYLDGEESHTLYYPFKIPKEKVLWVKRLCRPKQDSGMAVMEFEDKASRNHFL